MPDAEATDRRTRGRPRTFDRQEAVERAMVLFWRHGYDGIGVSELAAEMGISPPSMYHAFGSKAGLFREAVDAYNAPERSLTRRALDDPGSPADVAVERALRDNARAYTSPEAPTGCLVALSELVTAPANDQLAAYLRGLRDADRRLVEDRLARGVAEGDLPGTLDHRAHAGLVHAVLLGLSAQARDGADERRLQAEVDAFMAAWRALLDGLGGPGRRP